MLKQLQLPESQKALLILDVFKGLITDPVKCKLDLLSILMVQVAANVHVTPFPITGPNVNKAAKQKIICHLLLRL